MTLNDLHCWLLSALRYPRGFAIRRPASRQPTQLLHLYEFEACPFCRKVREVLSELDIAFVNHPCPRGGDQRDEVVRRGGKAMFPYLVDPNTGKELYESEDIIEYLFATYGGAPRSAFDRAMKWPNTLMSALTSALRFRGGRVRPGCEQRQQPTQLLELYSFEISPYCRKVREELCELNLSHVVHNIAKRSHRRPDFKARGGKMMVPYLIDPNQGVEMYESQDIIAYLRKTYGPAAD